MSEDPIPAKPLNLCGPHLRRLRCAKGLTLIDVQEALQRDYGLSIHRTNLGRLERQKRSISEIELVVLAHLLEVSLEQLVWGDSPPDTHRVSDVIKRMMLPEQTDPS